MKSPIFDLHCDLLGSVDSNEEKFGFTSSETRCSIPQLIEGNVKLQVLAVAAIDKNRFVQSGRRQVALYQKLLHNHRKQVRSFREFSLNSNRLHFLLAIENASALVGEEESLDLLFERFEAYRAVEEILYVSLTWNFENRFGGGNESTIGLKEDGKVFLQYLDGKKVAIDLSHTSDQLAHDLLNYIEQKSLDIPVIASHSNYRSILNAPRNLPEELAKEIIQRNGIIGMNFVKRFVGKTPDCFVEQIHHALKLGGEDSLSIGADFYGGLDLPNDLCSGKEPRPFFDSFSDSSCYPKFLDFLKTEFSHEIVEKIAYRNAHNFLNQTLLEKDRV